MIAGQDPRVLHAGLGDPQVDVALPAGQVGRGVAFRRLSIEGVCAGEQTVDGHLSRLFRLALPLAGHVVALEPQRVHPQLHGQLCHHLPLGLPLSQHISVQGLGTHIHTLSQLLIIQLPLLHQLTQPLS